MRIYYFDFSNCMFFDCFLKLVISTVKYNYHPASKKLSSVVIEDNYRKWLLDTMKRSVYHGKCSTAPRVRDHLEREDRNILRATIPEYVMAAVLRKKQLPEQDLSNNIKNMLIWKIRKFYEGAPTPKLRTTGK